MGAPDEKLILKLILTDWGLKLLALQWFKGQNGSLSIVNLPFRGQLNSLIHS